MKVIVVSHGSYARGLVDTAQMIAGEQEDLEAFGLEPEESVDTLREKIRESIEQTSEGEEVLILTDLFYGSPFNTVISLMSALTVVLLISRLLARELILTASSDRKISFMYLIRSSLEHMSILSKKAARFSFFTSMSNKILPLDPFFIWGRLFRPSKKFRFSIS